MEALLAAVLLAGAYLLGAVPFGLVVGRLAKGVDIRRHGSRNLGATNAGRVLGWPYGALVFALDFGKGLVPVLAAARVPGGGQGWVELAAGGAAMVGHVFPVYLGFRGGKGAATGLGACFGLSPAASGISVGVFAVTLLASRFVSLGSILAALSLPIAFLLTERERALEGGGVLLIGLGALSLLVVLRHRSNIARLLNGTESRIGRRTA